MYVYDIITMFPQLSKLESSPISGGWPSCCVRTQL